MVNRVQLIGNLGKDPEIKTLEGGNQVANFSLATSEKFKNKAGETVTNTEWHNIVIWGKLAAVVERYVKKGDKLFLAGKIQTRSWEKDGETKYRTEIVCNEMTMLGGNPSHGSSNGQAASNPADNGYNGTPGTKDSMDVDDLPF